MNRCLIIANSFKKDAVPLAKEVSCFLKEKGIQSFTFTYDGKSAEAKDVLANFKGYDFVLTLGGDGTVLFASRGAAPLGIPVFAINLGEFGFLATVSRERWKEELENFIEKRGGAVERYLVDCEVLRGGKSVFCTEALNDIVVSGKNSVSIINLSVAYNHALLGPFKTTGLIVATATGSTAYSAAAGGPIIDPAAKSLLLTPISPFSLSARALVFSGSGELTITVLPSRDKVSLTADGQIFFELMEGDILILRISTYTVRLACATEEHFYAALQSKLNWSGGPRA